MQVVGLTGGIGSGKSLVTQIFSHLGIPIFNADFESGKILEEDAMVRDTLTQWFGPEAYIHGKPDRRKIASVVFNDPSMLARMNELLHPRVKERFLSWCGQHQSKPYLIHEAAILFESGFYKFMDKTILVLAPEEIRIERVMQRDKVSGDSVRQRMQNQWTDEQKLPLADFIIRNDGKSPLIPAILEIHNKLIV